MRKLLLASLLSLAVGLFHGLSVSAQDPAATVPAGQVAPPLAVGDVSLAHSGVFIHVGKVGLGHEHAIQGKLRRGQVLLGAAQNAGLLEFDITSFQADTAEARQFIGLKGSISTGVQKMVTKNMLAADVLDVAKHPTALFQIKSALPVPAAAEANALPTYELVGDFALRGVTQPLSLVVSVESTASWQRLRGQFTLTQTKFGIQPYSRALGAIKVADNLQVFGDLRIVAAPPLAQ